MNKHQFLIVSNRLPVSVTKLDGKLVYTPSSGGLATAMSSLNSTNTPSTAKATEARRHGDPKDQQSNPQESNRLWVGWPGIASDELSDAEKTAITRKLRSYGCFPVFMTQLQVKMYYEGYCNDTVWPLFHYFQSLAVHDSDYWIAYKQVNLLYARAVAQHANPTATVWVHDYQLMLLPRLLRNKLPDGLIGFFLHIPFPSYEIFRLLPERKEILLGLLGADLIGFHIYDYARHFMSSVLRTLGSEHRHGVIPLEDRGVVVDSFPIGIDYKRFTTALDSSDVQSELKILDDSYQGQKVIVSVDRLDYSKGIKNRLEAFEQFLRMYPKQHKKVALVVIAVPSRIEVETYKDLRDAIEQSVSRINGIYGTVDWTPISYQFKNLPFGQIVALYAKADIALVTPLRDGMNLVAKEYVASKQKRPGVLILSEMAGAVDELPEALRINPNDIASIVQSICKALRMPKTEQRSRMHSMQRRISRYTVSRWAKDFIEQLEYAQQRQADQYQRGLARRDELMLLNDFGQAKKRLLLLDYDGTLHGFVDSYNPAKAAPGLALLKLIRNLAALPNTDVCVVSGRTRQALEDWFGHLPITLAAEHGAWIRQHGDWAQADISLQEYKSSLLPLLERYAERTPGARVEEKSFALVWHYRNVSPELAYARNASLKHDLNAIVLNSGIGVFNGNKIIEIKPRGITKGTVADETMATSSADFVLAIGDDYTDEDMFKALPESAYTIKVGNGETHARFHLQTVETVLELLTKLTSTKIDQPE